MLLCELLPENLDMFTTRLKGNLPIYQQLDLCNDMASGLQYLHDAGLVHTNLHGRNVLVSHDGHVKIGDYICPQVISCSEEVPTNNIPYLSPEAIADKSHCNEQSDIYSLGVLFLQVATQNIPESTDKTEFSKLSNRRKEMASIKNNPLLPIIHRCLINLRLGRPSVTQVLEQLATSMKSPQNVLSYSLYCKVSQCFKLCVCHLQVSVHLVSWNCFCLQMSPCMHACECACACVHARARVCLPLRALITSGIIWCDIDPLWLVYHIIHW